MLRILEFRNAQMHSAVMLEHDMLVLLFHIHARLANETVCWLPADADKAASYKKR